MLTQPLYVYPPERIQEEAEKLRLAILTEYARLQELDAAWDVEKSALKKARDVASLHEVATAQVRLYVRRYQGVLVGIPPDDPMWEELRDGIRQETSPRDLSWAGRDRAEPESR